MEQIGVEEAREKNWIFRCAQDDPGMGTGCFAALKMTEEGELDVSLRSR